MEELQEIINLLKKVFPRILENPKLMVGCDISSEEINNITENQQLSLKILQHVAGDTFFETFHKDIGLTYEETLEVGKFLNKSAPYYLEELKTYFPYLIE